MSGKSVLVKWIYSYLIILLIPMIAIWINYHYSAKIIKDNIVQANQLILDNLQENVDSYLNREMNLLSHVIIDSKFSGLIVRDEMDKRFYTDVTSIRELLSDYLNFDIGFSYLIYLKDKDYVIWDDKAQSSMICYDASTFYMEDIFSYDQWKTQISKEYAKDFFVNSYFSYAVCEPCLVYGNTINDFGYETANIFVYVPVSKIAELTKNLDDSSLLLLQQAGHTVLALDKDGIIEYGIETDGRVRWEIDAPEYVSVQKESSIKGINYCILIPKGEYDRSAIFVRNVLMTSLIVTILLAAVSVLFLAKYNYRPINRLLTKIGIQQREKNEFWEIEHVVDKMNLEREELNNKVLTHQEILLHNWILAKMKGTYVGVKEEVDCMLQLEIEESIFLVGFQIPMLDSNQLVHDDVLWFALDNVFSELMEQEKMYQIKDGNFLFYLFIVKTENAKEWKNNCIEKMNFVYCLLADKWECEIPAAISINEDDVNNLRFMYQDVVEALEYKSIIGGDCIIDAEMLKNNTESLSVNTVYVCIETALLKKDFDKLTMLTEKIFNNTLSIVALRMQVFEIFYMIIKFIDAYQNSKAQSVLFAGYLTYLLEASGKDAMKKIFKDFLTCVYQAISEKDNEYGVVDAVKEYVKKNYTDSSLNINYIADAIGKNARYISRAFKEETQEGILDYINRIRIEEAKILIRSGRYTMEEVGEMVGYASYKTFSRIFVKMMGITPGKYAENGEESVDR